MAEEGGMSELAWQIGRSCSSIRTSGHLGSQSSGCAAFTGFSTSAAWKT